VLLPLDELLDFAAHHAPALRRALGGHVLAADSKTAEELAQRWDLASVTPDGTISRR
jgi:hypothetical protein